MGRASRTGLSESRGTGSRPPGDPSRRTHGSLWNRNCLLAAALALGLLAGCTQAHYRRSADKQIYGLVQQAEQVTLGHTNAFTIDTPYSHRDPDSILPAELIEDRTTTNRRMISLAEALELGVRHSREYQNAKEELYSAARNLSSIQHERSPVFSGGTAGTLSGVGDRITEGRLRTTLGTRIQRLLAYGGSLSVTIANDLVRYFTAGNLGFGGVNKTAISSISVDLVQPLLKGFGKYSGYYESLTQAERNLVYGIRNYSLYQQEFAIGIVNDYFALLGQKDSIRNNYANYLRRADTVKYVEARSVDRAPLSDVDEMRTSELDAKSAYIRSIASYNTSLDAFKIKLGLPVSENLFLNDVDLRELEAAGLVPVGIGHEAAFRLAVEKHMDILNTIDQFEDSKRKIKVAVNNLKPGLDLTAGVTLGTDQPTDYVQFEQVRYDVGLALDLPLDRLNERNTYRTALISFESQLRNLTRTLDERRRNIGNGLVDLREMRLQYDIRKAALEVARRRVEMNQILLEAGRVEIRQVRDAQDALISAQNQVTQAVTSYLRLRLQLLFDIGILQTDVDRFWLKDPLAEILTEELRATAPAELSQEQLPPPDYYLEPRP